MYAIRSYYAAGCSDNASTTVTVYQAPDVSMIIPDDNFCFDDTAVDLTGILPGGIFSGTGVVNDKFAPIIAGSGSHEIVYTYTDINGCTNSASAIVEVSTPLSLSVSGIDLTCFGINTGTVTVNVSGGVPEYSYLWDDQDHSVTQTVNNLARITSYNVCYTKLLRVNGACSDTDTESVHVDSQVFATITPIGPFCETESAVSLTAITSGGVWSGTGVIGNTFDPAIAGPGDHIIQYDIVNGACSDTDTESVHVDFV